MTAPIDDGGSPPTGKRARPVFRVATVADKDPRPDIVITADVHIVTEQMTTALRADPDLYQRAGELVHVVRHDDESDPHAAVETPLVRACPSSWLVDRVSTHARCMKKKKGGDYGHVPPPKDRVQAVLDRGEWRGLRRLEYVIESPSMRPDGTIIQDPGYDAATRSLYVPNDNFLRVEDEPSHSAAVLAYAHLADVFRDFPFVNESHRSASISAALTLLARPAIRGSVPCWLFDASAARSGKSLQIDICSIIATGRKASRMTWPDNPDELEKVLSAYALSAARIIPFDNIASSFGGAALDKCITATDSVDLRILGRTEMRTLPWRAVVFGSGNNVQPRGDILPRLLAPRLESPLESPELRELRDLRAYVHAHRASLVRDALTILRAYVVAGRPIQEGVERWGGFEQWTALIPHALVWVGAMSPMGARRGLAGDEDPARIAEGIVVSSWDAICGPRAATGITTSAAIQTLYPPTSRHDDERPPDGFDDAREAIELLTRAKVGHAPSPRQLGEALGKMKARNIGGLKLVIDGSTDRKNRWRAARA